MAHRFPTELCPNCMQKIGKHPKIQQQVQITFFFANYSKSHKKNKKKQNIMQI